MRREIENLISGSDQESRKGMAAKILRKQGSSNQFGSLDESVGRQKSVVFKKPGSAVSVIDEIESPTIRATASFKQ